MSTRVSKGQLKTQDQLSGFISLHLLYEPNFDDSTVGRVPDNLRKVSEKWLSCLFYFLGISREDVSPGSRKLWFV